ncbi:MAG: hypothetical protein ACLFVU_03415 [Phycisphaerae bacterium]
MIQPNSPHQDKNPDHLMKNFSRSRILPGALLALVIHVIVIGVFSIGTFAKWLSPPETSEPENTLTTQPTTSPATQPATQPDDGAEQANPEQEDEEDKKLDSIKDTKIGKELTTKEKPPENPLGGFDLDDTE